MRALLGLDLGTSAVKAVALDDRGTLVAAAAAPYPTHAPRASWAEQDPADWTAAAVRALRRVAEQAPARAAPQALAVVGQLPTLALLDRRGQALRPAIVWYDGRAAEESLAMLRTIGPEEWYRRSGIVLDAHYLAPMYAWIAVHEPALLRGGYRVCGAKDALLHALTGALITDPTTASGYGVYAPVDGRWDAALCTAAGLDSQALPPLAEPWAVAGGLTAEIAGMTGLPAGLPVVIGAADSLAGVLGCGAAAPGAMAAIGGTSTAMLVSLSAPVFDHAQRFFLTPHAAPGLWGVEMDLMATGSALQWLASRLGLADVAALEALAAQSPPGARGLLALPYLAGGEQGALWDPDAPGAVVGLTLAHGPADLARAMLEGIICEMRRCLLAWTAAGVAVREVILSGAGSPFFARLVAAALDRTVQISPVRAASAVGAALLAGLGVGVWDISTLTALGRATLGTPVTASPDEVVRSAALYERYERASSALRHMARAARVVP